MSRTLAHVNMPGLVVVAALVGAVAATAGWATTPQRAEPVPGDRAASEAAAPRHWTVQDLLPAVERIGPGRDWMQGGRLFEQAGCGLCHAMSTYWEGNGLAPDLTAVGSKYSRAVILQSILEPSAALNGQYYHTEFTLKDGTVIRGTVVGAVDGRLQVAPVMMVPDVTVEIAKADIASEAPSPVSPMPAGLVDTFTREQILDLMAFLEAGGDPEAAIYRQ